MKTWIVGLVLLASCSSASTSDRDAIAKEETAEFRKQGAAVQITFDGDTMIMKRAPLCRRDSWPMLFGGVFKADGIPIARFDVPRFVRAGIKRVECETDSGEVVGVDIPIQNNAANNAEAIVQEMKAQGDNQPSGRAPAVETPHVDAPTMRTVDAPGRIAAATRNPRNNTAREDVVDDPDRYAFGPVTGFRDAVKPVPVVDAAPAQPADAALVKLTREQLTDGLALVADDVRACKRPDVHGLVKLRIAVLPSGVVGDISRDVDPDRDLSLCVEAAVRKAKFPATTGGGSVVAPFGF